MSLEVSGHFYLELTDEDLERADGDFQRAAQNVVGHTGAVVTDVMDEDDRRSL